MSRLRGVVLLALAGFCLAGCSDPAPADSAAEDPSAVWTAAEWMPLGLVAEGSQLYFSYAQNGELWLFDEIGDHAELIGTANGGVSFALDADNVYYVDTTRYRHGLGSLLVLPRGGAADELPTTIASAPFAGHPTVIGDFAYVEVQGTETRALMAVSLDDGSMTMVREIGFREDEDSPFGGVSEYLDAVHADGDDLILVGNFLQGEGNPAAMLRLSPTGEETRTPLPTRYFNYSYPVPGGMVVFDGEQGGLVRVDWSGEVTFIAEAIGQAITFTNGKAYAVADDYESVVEIDLESGAQRSFATPGYSAALRGIAATERYLYWSFAESDSDRYGIRRVSLEE